MANDYGREPATPAIPDIRTGKVETAVQAIKEWVEVRQGKRGDPLDRAVTMRDLLNAGVVTPQAVGDLVGGTPPVPTIPGTVDSAIPPTPTNLAANGARDGIILTWDFPRAYSRLAYFEVWRSETDAIGDASQVAQPVTTVFTDIVGPETTYYYWVRAVSDAGTSPYNAVLGTRGDTPFFLQPEDTIIDGIPVAEGVYLGSAWIRDGIITNAKIANLAVDDAKISDLSAEKITAGFIDAARIEAGSLDAKIANLDAAKITSGFIDTARIQDASIAGAKIANATITAANIADATITAAKIEDATITSAKIEDATIAATKFSDVTSSDAMVGDDPVLSINWRTGDIQHRAVDGSGATSEFDGTTWVVTASNGVKVIEIGLFP